MITDVEGRQSSFFTFKFSICKGYSKQYIIFFFTNELTLIKGIVLNYFKWNDRIHETDYDFSWHKLLITAMRD